MISPDYCLMMARYNAWQNKLMKQALEALPHEDVTQERGAFFGSILATVNHVLWGDLLWMARFDDGTSPEGGIAGSTDLTPTVATWGAERFRADGRILHWADDLRTIDLIGTETWESAAAGKVVSVPIAQCIMHLFNHQTHHRGQVHGMVTAAGGQGWVTDLFLMPEQGPWL